VTFSQDCPHVFALYVSAQVLLPGHSGTLAECVSQLLVQLVLACHMEAVQLSGYWRAGGSGSVQPGERLAAHNHSWVAVKVSSVGSRHPTASCVAGRYCRCSS
jgi:hypothetical protein